MKAFEYSAPQDEADVVSLLSSMTGETEILAGGTDLLPLMQKMILTPSRLVNIKNVPSLKRIDVDSNQGVTIGAAVTLDDLLNDERLDAFPSIKQVIRNIAAPQLQQQGTLGGELCRRPNCWYFRNGYGLLEAAKLVERGENRFHAIFGNGGPAKFVSPSRLAPALIALGAQVRFIGPENSETKLPLELFYRTPRHEMQRETVLESNQLVTHLHIPFSGWSNAAYEVRHGEGPDEPLASCAVAVDLTGGVVRNAQIVLGQVAPTPWLSAPAADAIVGLPITRETALAAGEAAVAWATPLSDNGYKVELAKVAVQRSLLLAAGLPTGGF